MPDKAEITAAAWADSLSLGDILTLIAGRKWADGTGMTEDEALTVARTLIAGHPGATLAPITDLTHTHDRFLLPDGECELCWLASK